MFPEPWKVGCQEYRENVHQSLSALKLVMSFFCIICYLLQTEVLWQSLRTALIYGVNCWHNCTDLKGLLDPSDSSSPHLVLGIMGGTNENYLSMQTLAKSSGSCWYSCTPLWLAWGAALPWKLLLSPLGSFIWLVVVPFSLICISQLICFSQWWDLVFVAIIAVLCAESLWASRQHFKRSKLQIPLRMPLSWANLWQWKLMLTCFLVNPTCSYLHSLPHNEVVFKLKG